MAPESNSPPPGVLGDTRPPGSGPSDPHGDDDLKRLLQPWSVPKQTDQRPFTILPPHFAVLPDEPGTLAYSDLRLLERAAGTADELAEAVRTGLGRTTRSTDAAADALRSGFTSAAALEGVMTSWATAVRGFADHVDTLSPRLKSTAKAYRDTEEGNRDQLNKIWNVYR